MHLTAAIGSVLCAAIVLLPCCAREAPITGDPQQGETPTNRLDVPPDVVNNLGITFAHATRGRLGRWREVPGQLVVPESNRWVLRAPARARIVTILPRWHVAAKDAEIVRLASPDLQTAQRAIELAESTFQRATAEVAAARARLAESEAFLKDADGYERASRQRLAELQDIGQQGNALTAREILEARSSLTDAGKGRLDAAMARDDVAARVATKQMEADHAQLTFEEGLASLGVLVGTPVAELRAEGAAGPAWRRLESLVVRAPASSTVVELHVAQGEFVEPNAPLVELLDTSELRFRGWVPEADLGAFAVGNRIRLEFPSRHLQSIETTLAARIPVADPSTRMVHVEAVVQNESGVLAHGMSVMAQVLVEESKSEEVLIPTRCVVLDGLEAIVFKRDASDPNVVIRTPVELGARAAGRVEVLAGVLDGDAIVADGVHQLKQTGLGKAPDGGHFHADGTWHGEHK
jgi:RND family efflux transporter MFP subunit